MPKKKNVVPGEADGADAPDLRAFRAPASEMRAVVERYAIDRATLLQKYPLQMSGARHARMRRFYLAWRDALESLDFETLNQDDRIDYLLFVNLLNYELRQIDLRTQAQAEMAPLLPFAPALLGLEEARQRMEWADPEQAAALLIQIHQQIEATQQQVEATLAAAPSGAARPW